MRLAAYFFATFCAPCKREMPYLEQLLQSAVECRLWPHLDLARLQDLDRTALFYLMDGENRDFSIESCPSFIREWMDHERDTAAA